MAWTPWLAAIAPAAYFLAAAIGRAERPRHEAIRLAGWVSLACSLGGLAAALAFGPATTPLLGVAGLGLAAHIDPLSGVLSSLIALIGLIVVGYSRNYLAGDPRQAWFISHLCLTLGLVQALVLSGNLGGLVLCWIGVSVALNRLLLFRGERQAAVLAARKRFLVSRLSEACLIGAAILLWRLAGSGDIDAIREMARLGGDLTVPALLLAGAAILASAQAPVHGWILEVMETPTPVSALLHAGVVNAGGFLILRFADVIAAQPSALLLLAVVGAVTALFGSLVMLTQTSVKVGLAYSTIAQMGFMLLECGLGAFSAALLHILAHALYKAHAFLGAGDAVRPAAAPAAEPRRLAPALAVGAPLLVAAGAIVAAAFGQGPAAHPGGFVLGAVLILSLARLWLDVWSRGTATPGIAAFLTAILLGAYVAGQGLFAGLLAGSLPALRTPGLPEVALSIAVVTLMTALLSLQAGLPGAAASRTWRRAYALIANGFYLNTLANRWVLQFWPAPPQPRLKSGVAQ